METECRIQHEERGPCMRTANVSYFPSTSLHPTSDGVLDKDKHSETEGHSLVPQKEEPALSLYMFASEIEKEKG